MRSDPMGACGPCFSRMPIGSTIVAADFSIARGQSLAVSSSQRAGSSSATPDRAARTRASERAARIVLIDPPWVSGAHGTRSTPARRYHDANVDTPSRWPDSPPPYRPLTAAQRRRQKERAVLLATGGLL